MPSARISSCWSMPTALILSASLSRWRKTWSVWASTGWKSRCIQSIRRIWRGFGGGLILPVVSGEWLGSWVQFRDLLKAEAVDVIMPNITRCGGITGMMKIADLAMLENVTVAPHGVGAGIGIIAAIAACAVMPNFHIYEYNQLFNPLRHTVINEAINYAGGVLKPSAEPGLGLTLDEETIARYRAD